VAVTIVALDQLLGNLEILLVYYNDITKKT